MWDYLDKMPDCPFELAKEDLTRTCAPASPCPCWKIQLAQRVILWVTDSFPWKSKHCWPWFCSKSLVRKGKPDVCQIILSKANFPRLYSPWATVVSTESYSSVDEMNGHNKCLSLTQWVFWIKKNSGHLILTLIQPFKFPPNKGLLVIVV